MDNQAHANDTSCNSDEVSIFIKSLLDQQTYANTSTDFTNIDEGEECKDEPNATVHFDSVQPLLKQLNEKINANACSKFNIFREEIFNCCVRAMNRKTSNALNKISVKFSDVAGTSEGAVDEGGPTREMFRLVLNDIKDSEMFTGVNKKYISLKWMCLEKRSYYEAERLIALSLVHGGPAPHFFSDSFFLFCCIRREYCTTHIGRYR